MLVPALLMLLFAYAYNIVDNLPYFLTYIIPNTIGLMLRLQYFMITSDTSNWVALVQSRITSMYKLSRPSYSFLAAAQ